MGKAKDPRIAAIVARNIRLIRETKGLSQKALSEKVKWRYQSMLNQIEGGHRGMGPQTLRKLADALEVDPAVFYMEKLNVDPRLAEAMGVSMAPLEKPILLKGGESTFEVLCAYNLQDIHRESLPEEDLVGSLPILKGYPDRKNHDLVGAVVDMDDMVPEYAKGDMLCVDLDDRPSVGDAAEPAEYVCRIANENAVFRVGVSGYDATLEKMSRHDEGFVPLRLDLRLGAPVIIGKVLWAVKFHV